MIIRDGTYSTVIIPSFTTMIYIRNLLNQQRFPFSRFQGGDGRQGSRRPPDGWPSRPLHLSRPPCIPRRGNSRPPAPGEARATPAPDGPVMSLAAVRKWRAGHPGCHAACNQGTGRAAVGVTARAFSAGVPPALQPVTPFALSIVSDSGCLWQPGMGHASPVRSAPHPRLMSLRGW
jgi:hypothetical protein